MQNAEPTRTSQGRDRGKGDLPAARLSIRGHHFKDRSEQNGTDTCFKLPDDDDGGDDGDDGDDSDDSDDSDEVMR